MRGILVTLKVVIELALILTWVAFAVGIAFNDPPLRSIVLTFGLLALVTTIVVAFTRRLRR